MASYQTALITGASMGIGAAIARELAGQVRKLVLVARSEGSLKELADELASRHGIQTRVIAMDLGEPGAGASLHQQLTDEPVDILVNNAGFGLKGSFLDLPLADQQKMMQLNMGTLTDLCHLFGNEMVKRGRGRILNVASVAAFQAGPKMAIYCATKAFVLSLSEALDAELEGTDVRVTALCPGAVDTNFHAVARNDSKMLLSTAMPAEPVARAGVRALLKGKRVTIPGWINGVSTFTGRLMPRKAMNSVTKRLIEG